MDTLWPAFTSVALDPGVLLTILVASAYGVFMGAVPGLSATMAVALIVPITYFLPPLHAAAAVVALEACAIFAGDIPGALLRIPGTPSSAAYVDDAFAWTRRGLAERALRTCLAASVVGGLFGTACLFVSAGGLARVATAFSAIEYFWFYLIGLGCAVVIAQGAPLRGLVALCVGLLLSTIGLSAAHPEPRFAFGVTELYQGIPFVPAMIGLFGLSEVLRHAHRAVLEMAAHGGGADGSEVLEDPGASAAAASRVPWRRKLATLRSGALGFAIGMLPGAGADIAGWVSYAVSKRRARRPEEYGRGSLDGIADGSSANSAALAGAWVPALSFGIPGDSITAILIGILLMKDVKLGPALFEKQASLAYGLYFAFLLANLALIPVGLAAIRAGTLLVRIPRRILLPIVTLCCILGSYAVSGSRFDVGIMAALGVLGFFLERWRLPLGPVVLGIVLGGPVEESFLQAMAQTGGRLAGLFSRPLAAALALCALAVPATRLIRRRAGHH